MCSWPVPAGSGPFRGTGNRRGARLGAGPQGPVVVPLRSDDRGREDGTSGSHERDASSGSRGGGGVSVGAFLRVDGPGRQARRRACQCCWVGSSALALWCGAHLFGYPRASCHVGCPHLLIRRCGATRSNIYSSLMAMLIARGWDERHERTRGRRRRFHDACRRPPARCAAVRRWPVPRRINDHMHPDLERDPPRRRRRPTDRHRHLARPRPLHEDPQRTERVGRTGHVGR